MRAAYQIFFLFSFFDTIKENIHREANEKEMSSSLIWEILMFFPLEADYPGKYNPWNDYNFRVISLCFGKTFFKFYFNFYFKIQVLIKSLSAAISLDAKSENTSCW